MVGELEAPDDEAVRASFRSVGVVFNRIWVAEVSAEAEAPIAAQFRSPPQAGAAPRAHREN